MNELVQQLKPSQSVNWPEDRLAENEKFYRKNIFIDGAHIFTFVVAENLHVV